MVSNSNNRIKEGHVAEVCKSANLFEFLEILCLNLVTTALFGIARELRIWSTWELGSGSGTCFLLRRFIAGPTDSNCSL